MTVICSFRYIIQRYFCERGLKLKYLMLVPSSGVYPNAIKFASRLRCPEKSLYLIALYSVLFPVSIVMDRHKVIIRIVPILVLKLILSKMYITFLIYIAYDYFL
jgi:hypothetical protein